jgi:hypothetical protein
MTDDVTTLRLQLRAAGFSPVPAEGKKPPMEGWPEKLNPTDAEIRLWPKTWHLAHNTGVISKFCPGLDIDILDEDAAEAMEHLAREHFEARGKITARVGLWPKRLIPLRTDEPFAKLTRSFRAPDGTKHKIEVLGDGQQWVAFGEHPEAKTPYRWTHGKPGNDFAREDLPYVRLSDVEQFLDAAETLLIEQHGLTLVTGLSQPNGGEPREPGDKPLAPSSRVAAAVRVIANNDLEWDDWNRVAMAIWRATNGRSEGFAIFDAWSRGSHKYDQRATAKKWSAITKCPPDRIGFGTLKHLADQADPAWEDALRGEPPEPQPGDPGPQLQELPQPQSPGIRPIDLWGYFQPPELPCGVLPSVIETFAVATGETMGADPAGLAISALVVAGAAIPDGVQLQVKQHSRGWIEEARLWAFIVGLPSTKKSPILRAAAAPLIRIDHRLYRVYLKAQKEYDKLEPKERKERDPPRKLRLRIEDTTIEAAGEILRDSPGGVLCLQDELSGWFGAMDKYAGPRGANKDRGFWLQSWNGGEYAVDRISRGSFLIPNLSISVLGGVQPDAVRRIAGDTIDDGLIQRPLPVILRPGRVGHDQPTLTEPYDQLIEHLHRLPAYKLEFDPAAQEVRIRLERKHNELLALEALHRKLAAHIGKYDGYFARLCIVWHCIEHAQTGRIPTSISVETAERVARFMHEFLLPHALAFYSGVLALTDDHDQLTAVAGYILARGLERITTRDVARGDRTMRRLTRQDTNAVFEQLEALGWLARKSAPRPSDPPHWLVNPLCHQLFETRAKEEAERRAKIHEMIKESVRMEQR